MLTRCAPPSCLCSLIHKEQVLCTNPRLSATLQLYIDDLAIIRAGCDHRIEQRLMCVCVCA